MRASSEPIPNIQPRDQVVIFCSDTNRTIAYLNDSSTSEVEDPSFCPAVMSVWLHPQTKHQEMRKSLLGTVNREVGSAGCAR